LRRLRDHRADLQARVLAGELSPHRAMIEAGFSAPSSAAARLLDDDFCRKSTLLIIESTRLLFGESPEQRA
jgi:hypothetical protein